jgi:hypothetical protein
LTSSNTKIDLACHRTHSASWNPLRPAAFMSVIS